MAHFKLREWADYVRDVGSLVEIEKMRKHLAAGCAPCARDERIFRDVLAFAERDARIDVPESEVIRVKQLAALQRPTAVSVGARGLAKLIFDSFREPFAMGVRNSAQTARHSLYCGAGHCIDFQQNAVPGGRTVSLVGQVTRNSGEREQVPQATVLLKAGRDILARATTNQFGEFQMEYAPRMKFRLVVQLPRRRGSVKGQE